MMLVADFSSPDDDDDDMIITLLLLAACDLAKNKTASFHESLTVDEIRRRSGKIRHHALQHPFSSPLWTLFDSKHDESHCVGSIVLPLSSYNTSYSSHILIPFLLVEKNGIHYQEFNNKIRSTQIAVFHHLSGT